MTRGFMPRTLLDFLATRLGLFSSIALVCLVCAWGGWLLKSNGDVLRDAQQSLDSGQARNGFVALSDLQRLLFIAQYVAAEGAASQEVVDDFASAVDIVFVRADTLRSLKLELDGERVGASASDALFEVVELADAALATNLSQPEMLLTSIMTSFENARRELVKFADKMSDVERHLLREQSSKLERLNLIVLTVFSSIALFGALLLFVLRKEVLGRKARETAEERANFLAYFDPLTELPNRVQFSDHVEARLRHGGETALFFVDLDDFKAINDTYGHAAGDAVLKAVGQRLAKAAMRTRGLASRLSGDEFALVVPSEAQTYLHFVADGLLEDLGVTVPHDADSLKPSASIGVATVDQVGKGAGADFASLARAADFALYSAKDSGRKGYAIYDQTLEDQFMARRAMLEDLPNARVRKELEVFLQPKVILPHGAVYGYEALVRWRREGVIVPPDQFIGLAEESGVVTDIDYFVLHEASALIAKANRDFAVELSVSVNLSAMHFNNAQIVDEVALALAQSGLPAHLLTLEMTETVELKDWDAVLTIVAELHKLGCKLSLDDFGSGYSSLAYLRKITADEIKIDRSLVDEIESSSEARHVIQSMLELSAGLGMDVVVEGIETTEQAEALFAMGGGKGQGYLFGSPRPAIEVFWDYADRPAVR